MFAVENLIRHWAHKLYKKNNGWIILKHCDDEYILFCQFCVSQCTLLMNDDIDKLF